MLQFHLSSEPKTASGLFPSEIGGLKGAWEVWAPVSGKALQHRSRRQLKNYVAHFTGVIIPVSAGRAQFARCILHSTVLLRDPYIIHLNIATCKWWFTPQ